jgi:hypothetical protein
VTRGAEGGPRPIERRTVSRKTPGDGKLEITKIAANRLASLGERFTLVVDAPHLQTRDGDARLGTMPCTCRGDDAPHVHYFIESDLLRALQAGSAVDLLLDDTAKRLLVVGA